MAGRFRLRGKLYEMSSINEISLKDLLLFNTQAEELGIPERWADVELAALDMSAMKTAREGLTHPMRNVVIAVTVWISRRAAGEDLSFSDAIDFPLAEVEFLPDPGDRKAGPTKGAAKKRPAKKGSKASGRAGGRAATKRTPTSARRSTTG